MLFVPQLAICSFESFLKREEDARMTCAQIEWPLSIVISQQAITQYQLVFRHLFELKYVERQLVGVWQTLQATRGLFR